MRSNWLYGVSLLLHPTLSGSFFFFCLISSHCSEYLLFISISFFVISIFTFIVYARCLKLHGNVLICLFIGLLSTGNTCWKCLIRQDVIFETEQQRRQRSRRGNEKKLTYSLNIVNIFHVKILCFEGDIQANAQMMSVWETERRNLMCVTRRKMTKFNNYTEITKSANWIESNKQEERQQQQQQQQHRQGKD